jgi:hypothetical protein
MQKLLIPMTYKSVLFWTAVAIVIAVTIGLLYDPGLN